MCLTSRRRGPEASDLPSDFAPRRRPADPATLRRGVGPDVRASNIPATPQTIPPAMACQRSGVRIMSPGPLGSTVGFLLEHLALGAATSRLPSPRGSLMSADLLVQELS